VPLLGTKFIETSEISGMRSIVHVALFVTFFYLGFIRKWKSHSITTYDQDSEKIREVITTWMRAHRRSTIPTTSNVSWGDDTKVFGLSGSKGPKRDNSSR
jgi:hypothetical protein